MRAVWLIGCILICFALPAQNHFGLPAPATGTAYHSEYDWISSTKVKFTFYTWRICSETNVFSLYKFPDTVNMRLFVNKKPVAYNIIAIRDSTFAHPYNKCQGIQNCFENGSSYNVSPWTYSIFRYSGIVDFNNNDIRDTLDKLNACMVDIAFMGRYAHITQNSNFEMPTSKTTIYGFLKLNRCYNWIAGDRSPVVRQFQPITMYGLYQRGFEQIDLGYQLRSHQDSLVHELSFPRKYPDTGYYSMNSPFSLSYYYPGYCPGGAPCKAIPYSNPPRGFYLHPKTGIARYYKVKELSLNPIFTVEIKVFRENNFGQSIHVATLVRQNINNLISSPYLDDSILNRMPFTSGLGDVYNVCEGKSDSIRFLLRDTLAVNQTVPDTLEYKLINDVPASTLWITDTLAREPEINLTWTAPENGYHNNPYTLNVYANEKLCDLNRTYLFRSAEFRVVPRPRMLISRDTGKCGTLRFSALSLLEGYSYRYRWQIYRGSDTLYVSPHATDSTDLPTGGMWHLRLTAENTLAGCKQVFTDSVFVHTGKLQAGIDPHPAVYCSGTPLQLSAQVAEAALQPVYRWLAGGVEVSDSVRCELKAIDSISVKLTIADGRGCKASDSTLISTFAQPFISLMPDTAFCPVAVLSLQAPLPSGADSLVWEHNGSDAPVQNLTDSGRYAIRYYYGNACMAYDTFLLRQVPELMPYAFSDVSLCRGDSLQALFSAQTGVAYDSLIWRLNGAELSRQVSLSHRIFSTSTLSLQVWGGSYGVHCTQSDTMQVTVHPDAGLLLQLQALDTCLSGNRIVAQVSGAASGRINWGDGSAEETLSPVAAHAYTSAGTFTTLAFTQDNNGCRDTLSSVVSIGRSPQMQISTTDSMQCLRGNTFTLQTNPQPPDLPQRIDWGDGNQSTLKGTTAATHRYDSLPNTGTAYTIRISGSIGACADTTELSIILFPHPEPSIAASGLCTGDSTYFSAQMLNGVPVLQYAWQLEAQPLSNQSGFAHRFAGAGTYRIMLSTNSDKGCTGSTETTVRITDRPEADFSFTSLGKEAGGHRFYFSNQSRGGTYWHWTFANTDTSSVQHPEYRFADTGYYPVVLIATAGAGCSDTAMKWIPVYDKLEFYFPNVFSPDGNGINEAFGLHPSQRFMVREFSLRIYNRWGELVYSGSDASAPWEGHKAQQGVYIWKAEIRDIYNVLHEYKGVVEVLR